MRYFVFAVSLAALAFTSGVAPAQDPSGEKAKEPAKAQAATTDAKSAEAQERAKTQELIRLLEETIRRTESAGEMAQRVQDIVKELEKKAQEEQVDQWTVLAASEDIQQILLNALDKLEDASRTVNDEVKGMVIPGYQAQIEGMRARHELTKDPKMQNEITSMIDQLTTHKSETEGQAERLTGNIQRIQEAKSMVENSMTLIGLWKRVNFKAPELVAKLKELNSQIERIHRTLVPSQ